MEPLASPVEVAEQEAAGVLEVLDRDLGLGRRAAERGEGDRASGERKGKESRKFGVELELEEPGVGADHGIAPAAHSLELLLVVLELADLLELLLESVESVGRAFGSEAGQQRGHRLP